MDRRRPHLSDSEHLVWNVTVRICQNWSGSRANWRAKHGRKSKRSGAAANTALSGATAASLTASEDLSSSNLRCRYTHTASPPGPAGEVRCGEPGVKLAAWCAYVHAHL